MLMLMLVLLLMLLDEMRHQVGACGRVRETSYKGKLHNRNLWKFILDLEALGITLPHGNILAGSISFSQDFKQSPPSQKR